MAERPLEGMMNVTLDKIRDMIGSDTIIGDPIVVDDTKIIPVSKVTFGFASGGSDFGAKTTKDLFGGGSGAGVTVTPVAFLVVNNGNVRPIQLADKAGTIDRALDMLPELVDKLSALLNKDKDSAPDKGGETPQ